MREINWSNKRIQLGGKEIDYTLRQSHRAKHMAVIIKCGGSVVVTKPDYVAESRVEDFLRLKADWIIKKIDYQSKNKESSIWQAGKKEYMELKDRALQLVEEKISYFNAAYHFNVGCIKIRNQKTRWGSCSRNGNMNFNFRIAMLPEKLVDYLVVHELCHLGQMNHSPKFWSLVSAVLPNYQELRRELKETYR